MNEAPTPEEPEHEHAPESAIEHPAPHTGPDRAALHDRRRLAYVAGWALACLLAYSVYQGWQLPPEQLGLGLAIVFLAGWPAVRWIRLQPYPFPAFETFMLTGVSAYALPMLTEHTLVAAYTQEIVVDAALSVLLFQVCALAAYFAVQPHEQSAPFWNEPLFNRDISAWLPLGLWLNFGYIYVSRFTDLLPGDIDSVLRAVFFGLNTACTFLLGRKWGADELSQGAKANLIIVTVLQSLLMIASLYLINSITGLLVLLLAYVSAGKKVPILGLGLIFTVFTVLHNGKTPMREKYWGDFAPKVGITALPSFYGEWITHGLSRQDERTGTLIKKKNLLDRASLMQMLCLVIDLTDYQGLPKLRGETYGHIPAQLVPRFFWPGKPSGQATTKLLGKYFRLQDDSSSATTSIAFGILAEAYANFGMLGIAFLGVLIGWSNKVVSVWTRTAPLLSNGGFVMILLMAWAVQVELPMSNWVASLYQAAICVLGIPYALRRLLG